MDRETIIKYSPFVLVCVSLLFQWNLFVTPERLEVKHREILKEVQTTYTTKEQYNDLKNQLNSIQTKIDKIYDIITKR